MKTPLNLLMVLLIVIGLSSCSSYNYYTAGLNKTNMNQYRSFAWMPPQGKNATKSNLAADTKVKDAAVMMHVRHEVSPKRDEWIQGRPHEQIAKRLA